MSFWRGFGVALFALGLDGVACSTEQYYPPAPPCTGAQCGGAVAGGSNPTTGGTGGLGGAGGAVGASDVTGTVDRILDVSFVDMQTPFNGSANIVALPANAAMISTPYGGSAGTTFTELAVPPGWTWFFVQDASGGGAGILSTLSLVQVPALASVALPVIDLGTLSIIANGLPTVSANGVSPLASQIILMLTHANAPYKGLSVTGSAGSAQIAYDLAPGVYTDTGTATGTAGTVILFNATLSGTGIIQLTDVAANKQYAVSVRAAFGAATIVAADLE